MDASRSGAALRNLAQNLLVAVSVSGALVGGGEALARRFERRGPLTTPDTDSLLDWEREWKGDFYTLAWRADWPLSEPINRDGLRDRAHAPGKAEGVQRIVCLGDSVTLGPDLYPEQAFPQVLQARLDALGPGAEVFNVALWGWATRQERIAYERLVRKYRPDQVVVGICLNDVQDLQNNLGRPPAIVSALHRRSALVRRVVDARGREIRGIEELFARPEPPQVRAGFERLFDELRALRRSVESDGATLSVVVFPYRAQVTAAAPEPTAQARIGRFCAAEGLPFLDLLPALSELGERAFEEEDGLHFNREGCARVAEALVASGLVRADAVAAEGLGAAQGLEPADDGGAQLLALMRLLDDARPRLRAEAVWALGRLGTSGAAAVPGLRRALADPSELVRLTSARALGRLGDAAAEALPALLTALDDPRPSVRLEAARATVTIGPRLERDVPALQAALGSADPYVRGAAAWCLGRLGPLARTAAPTLAKAAHDSDPGVRLVAIRALGRAGERNAEALTALESALAAGGAEERRRAARSLGRLGPDAAAAAPALARALSDPDGRVRLEAAVALGRLGPAAAAVREALTAARADADGDVRAAAARSLERIGEPAAAIPSPPSPRTP